MRVKLTTDVIVGAGLVVALLLSIVFGGSSELQTNLSAGLVGYLGRSVSDHAAARKDDVE